MNSEYFPTLIIINRDTKWVKYINKCRLIHLNTPVYVHQVNVEKNGIIYSFCFLYTFICTPSNANDTQPRNQTKRKMEMIKAGNDEFFCLKNLIYSSNMMATVNTGLIERSRFNPIKSSVSKEDFFFQI